MEQKKKVLLFLILALVLLIFFNLQYLGFSISNTTSNVTVIPANYYPQFQTVNSTLFVCERTQLYYEFNASDQDGDVLTGDITPENPFYVFWISQQTPNIQTFAIVSGFIGKSDVGGMNNGY